MNLFGEEFENPCACAEKPAENKNKKADLKEKNSKPTSQPEVSKLKKAKLPSRTIRVKMYSDFYEYTAPEEVKEPTLEDVRLFMINQHGFTELLDENRAGLTIIEPPNEEPYVYCGVKFEKMG